MGSILHVSNLADLTTNLDLEALFGQAGTVVSAAIMCDKGSGQPRGFAFVQMADDAGALKALRAFNRTVIHGSQIEVSEARQPEDGAVDKRRKRKRS